MLCVCADWPLSVVDGSSAASSSDHFHKSLEEATLTVKTCYWSVIY